MSGVEELHAQSYFVHDVDARLYICCGHSAGQDPRPLSYTNWMAGVIKEFGDKAGYKLKFRGVDFGTSTEDSDTYGKKLCCGNSVGVYVFYQDFRTTIVDVFREGGRTRCRHD